MHETHPTQPTVDSELDPILEMDSSESADHWSLHEARMHARADARDAEEIAKLKQERAKAREIRGLRRIMSIGHIAHLGNKIANLEQNIRSRQEMFGPYPPHQEPADD